MALQRPYKVWAKILLLILATFSNKHKIVSTSIYRGAALAHPQIKELGIS